MNPSSPEPEPMSVPTLSDVSPAKVVIPLDSSDWTKPQGNPLSDEEILESLRSVAQSVFLVYSNYMLVGKFRHVIEDLHISGKGMDLSDEHFVLMRIFNNALDALVLGITDLYKSSGVAEIGLDVDANGVKQLMLKGLATPIVSIEERRRGSWSLDFVLRQFYHAKETSEAQRNTYKELYANIWNTIASPSYISAVTFRNQAVAHITNSFYFGKGISGPQAVDKIPHLPNFDIIGQWVVNAITFYNDTETTVLEGMSSHLTKYLVDMSDMINNGTRVLMTEYTAKSLDQGRPLLRRLTDSPDFGAVFSKHEHEWKGQCTCLFVTRRDPETRLWTLYKKILVRGEPDELELAKSNQLKDLHQHMVNYVSNEIHYAAEHLRLDVMGGQPPAPAP